MFGVEWLADMTRIICEAYPGTTIQDVAWGIPLSTFSYMVAMGLRAAGVKGVERRPDTRKVKDRTDQLVKQWVAEHERS